MTHKQNLAISLTIASCWLGGAALGGEAGDITFPVTLGTSVYSHRFAAYGKSSADITIGDTFGLSEFVGAGYFVTNRFRLGLNLQFTEAITEPTPAYPSPFTTFVLLPQFNYNFWGPLTASFVPGVVLRLNGTNQIGFVPQAVLSAAVPLGGGFSATFAIEIPVFVYPILSIGITPLVGIVFRLPRKPAAPLPASLPKPPGE